MNFNVRVEYEPLPIRHIAVQCPECKNWFHGMDMTDDELCYSYQIDMASYCCPVCHTTFGRSDWNNFKGKDKPNIEEVSYPDVYNPECTLDYKHHDLLDLLLFEYFLIFHHIYLQFSYKLE